MALWNGLVQSWGYICAGASAISSLVMPPEPPPVPQTTPEEGLEHLQSTLKVLLEKEGSLEERVEHHAQDTLALLQKGDRQKAIIPLRRKKIHERQLNSLRSVISSVEAQCLNLESCMVNAEAYKAMKSGASAMKALQLGAPTEEAEEVMLDLTEHLDQSKELADVMSQALDPSDLEEEALFQELDQMMHAQAPLSVMNEEVSSTSLPESGPDLLLQMPQAPTSQLEHEEKNICVNQI